MDSLKRVVKVEKTSSESLNLRRIFGPGSCGEIRALYASGFIEFADAAGAQRALSLKLDMPGIRVLDVSSQPRLVDQYRVVNPSAFPANTGNVRSSGARNDWSGGRRTPLGNPSISCTNTPVPEPDSSTSTPRFETGLFLNALKSSDTPISNPSGPKTDAENYPISTVPTSSSAAVSRPFIPAVPPSTAPSASSGVNPFPCIENRIILRLCGENIALDLRSLPDNPATIIELLKATSSERGNWILVGAYYRRTNNPRGAKAVVTAMLEAMAEFNIPETEFKPAHLLLAGCETDLGKMARSKGADPSQVSKHFDGAQKWLHKVYGARVPPPTPDQLGADSSKDKNVSKSITPPRAPASLRSRIDKSAPSGPRAHIPPSPNRMDMERELQSLRERQMQQENALSDIRSSKRKLEESVDTERDVRRRLQRELDDVVKERDNARRMENFVLGQMKKEVESRRRAEDRAEEERELRKRVESSAEFAIFQRSGFVGGARMANPANDRRSPEAFTAYDTLPHRMAF